MARHAVLIGMTTLLSFAGVAVAQVSLTVYYNDLAVVQRTVSMSLDRGVQTRTLAGVSDMIDPTSVIFEAGAAGVNVLDLTFRNDMADSRQVLLANIGRTVTIHLGDGDVVQGTLRAVNGDVVIAGENGGMSVIRLDAIKRYDLPAPRDSLAVVPTLVWTLNSDRARTVKPMISYMTGGLSWRGVYTAVTAPDEKSLELSADASITNNSAERYENAALKLVAGDVRREQQPKAMPGVMRTTGAEFMAQDSGVQERALFEYHVYDIGREVTIGAGATMQIPLFVPAGVPVEKRYVFDWRKSPEQVLTSLVFTTGKETGFDRPLPAGTIRTYTKDKDGRLTFIGEDAIDHTPAGEEVRLTIGAAFELSGAREVIETNRISQRVMEQTVRITLTNRKEEQSRIAALDYLWGDWEIVKASHDYARKNATTVEFTVTVPANGETVIEYTARYR